RLVGIARQADGACLGVALVEILVRADEGKAIAAGGQARQHFGEAQASRARRDRGERTAVFSGSVRLGIEGVEMTGRAPKPEQKRGAGAGLAVVLALKCGRQSRAGEGREQPRLQERAPAHAIAGPRPETADLQHVPSPPSKHELFYSHSSTRVKWRSRK